MSHNIQSENNHFVSLNTQVIIEYSTYSFLAILNMQDLSSWQVTRILHLHSSPMSTLTS
jgi:hypothetical protein